MARTPKRARGIASEILTAFGQGLEKEREGRGLTETDFIEKLGVSILCYRDWLAGKGDPSLFTIIDICHSLGWDERFIRNLFEHASDPSDRTMSSEIF